MLHSANLQQSFWNQTTSKGIKDETCQKVLSLLLLNLEKKLNKTCCQLMHLLTMNHFSFEQKI